MQAKIYKIFMQMYDYSELAPVPDWATVNLWVRKLKKSGKEYAFMQLRAAEMCIKWLEMQYPGKQFKIVVEE
jgi:hypothetical protein